MNICDLRYIFKLMDVEFVNSVSVEINCGLWLLIHNFLDMNEVCKLWAIKSLEAAAIDFESKKIYKIGSIHGATY